MIWGAHPYFWKHPNEERFRTPESSKSQGSHDPLGTNLMQFSVKGEDDFMFVTADLTWEDFLVETNVICLIPF